MDSETPQRGTGLAPLEPDPMLINRAYGYPYGPIATGAMPANDNGLLQYLPVLRKHRWTILATIIIVVTITTIVTLRTIPIYEAVGRIAIGHENDNVLGFKGTGEGFNGDDYDYDYTVALDTQMKILQSDAIALATAKALQLDKDPAFIHPQAGNDPAQATSLEPAQEAALMGFIQGGMRLAIIPKTRIIEIRFANPDPQLAAKVVNTIVNVYVEQNFKTKFDSAMQTSDWLSKQLTDLQLKVETSQEKLVRYQREHGILGIDEKQNIVTAKLDELNRELTSAEADRIQKEARYRLSLSGNPELISGGDSNTLLAKLRQQESELRTQIA